MKFCALALLTGLIAPVSSICQSLYSDMTAPASIPLTAGNDGVFVADFNRDGLEDFYVNFPNQKNQLFKNNGDGTFTELAQSAGVAVDAKSTTAVWGDINNDGYPDLYVARQALTDQFFLNNGDETFTNISQQAGIGQIGYPFAVNMADINKDGFLDIYVTNFLAENVMYLNNGNNTFTDVSFQSRAFDTGKSMGTIFFDYDNDGDADLYLVHDGNEPNFLYQNNGNGVFTEVGQVAGANTQSFGMGVDAGDINNDGFLDLYITNLFHNFLLRNNGDGTFTEISASAQVDDNGMGWGTTFLDYDNDGWLDIYAVNDYTFSPYPNILYRNLGDQTFEKVDLSGSISNKRQSYGTACFDYNLDGKPDLLVANRGATESMQLFQNDATTGSWIGIKLHGIQSNRDAIGAKIRIEDAFERIHIKELTAGHGWKSQNSGILLFGFGHASAVKTITIYWPSGLVQTIDPLALNSYYTIEEGGAPQPGLAGGNSTAVKSTGNARGFDFSLSPNPAPSYESPVAIHLNLPEASPLQLEVFDQTGRLLLQEKYSIWQAGESVLRLKPALFAGSDSVGSFCVRLTSPTMAVVKQLVLVPQK